MVWSSSVLSHVVEIWKIGSTPSLERDLQWPNGKHTGLRIKQSMFKLAEVTVFHSSALHFTLTESLSAQVYNRMLVNVMPEITLQRSHFTLSSGRVEILLMQSLHAVQTRAKYQPDGRLGLNTDFTLYSFSQSYQFVFTFWNLASTIP